MMTEISKTPLIAAGAFAAGLALGAVAGAKFVEKKLELEFEKRLERETNAVREFYGAIRKEHDTPPERLLTPAESKIVAKMVSDTRKQGEPIAYHKIAPGEEVIIEDVKQFDEVVAKNVFVDDRERPAEIYQISGKEFEENESNFLQPTLTYYAGDNVLTDEHEEPIEDRDKTVGTFTIADFGKHCDDENTLHVRNEILQLEFEIVKNEGRFDVVVLGEDEPVTRPRDRIRGG